MTAHSAVGGRTRVAVVTAVLLALLALLSLLTPGIAAAHSATGTMTVTKFEAIGPNRVTLQVGLIFTGDEHLAQDATVSATLKSAAGESVGPVTLTKAAGDSSLYAAEIDVTGPGQWTAEVTSTNPSATATASVDVAAEATTTSTTAETTTSAAPATTAATDNPDAADNSGSTTATGAENNSDKDSDDDSSNSALYAGLAALALIIVFGFALVLNKMSGKESKEDDHGDDSPRAV